MEGKFKILWIDDDVNGPELMSERDALEEKKCIVSPITNIDDLDFNKVSSFDCIIIDLSMPIGKKFTLVETRGGSRTGWVILQKIKDINKEIKAIIYTVFDIPEVKVYCQNNGIAYWNKSDYLADDFANAVVELINKTQDE